MGDQIRTAVELSHVAIVLVIMMMGGWYLGTKADAYFRTGTVLQLVGFFLGFAGGLTYLIMEVLKLNDPDNTTY